MTDISEMFIENTPLGHTACLTRDRFERHIWVNKWGWERPSGFEVKRSVTDPVEVYQSRKDPDSYYYVNPVGLVGSTQWHTITFVKTSTSEITTSYNTISYSQKGKRVYTK